MIDLRPQDQNVLATSTSTSWNRGRDQDQLLWDRFRDQKVDSRVKSLTSLRFAADMLRHDVTLTFDLLTLNFYSTSAVTWLNSVYRILAKSNSLR